MARSWANLLIGCVVCFPATAEPPAGVIPYSCFEGAAYVLLAYDGASDREGYGAFGGTANTGEELYDTASREFHEETGCVFPNVLPLQLKNQTSSKSNEEFHTYVAEVPYIAPKIIELSNCGTKDELKDWVWISLEALNEALDESTEITGLHPTDEAIQLWADAQSSIKKARDDGLLPRKSSDACQ